MSGGGRLGQPLMSATEDPYYLFRECVHRGAAPTPAPAHAPAPLRSNVTRDLEGAGVLLQKWNSLLHAVNTADSSDFKAADAGAGRRATAAKRRAHHAVPRAPAEVKAKVTGVAEALGMLKGMVQRVVSARAQFGHIDDAELAERKAFVSASEGRLAALRGELNSATAKGKLEADERASLASAAAASRDVPAASAFGTAHGAVFASQQQVRRTHEAQHEEHLGEIDNSLSRLGEMARNIDTELEEQAAMLEDAGEEIDDAQSKMDANMRVITKFLQTKDTCQLATIAILVLILVGLFIAVLSGV